MKSIRVGAQAAKVGDTVSSDSGDLNRHSAYDTCAPCTWENSYDEEGGSSMLARMQGVLELGCR